MRCAMKRRSAAACFAAGFVLVAAAFMLVVGCEEADGPEGLTVTPEEPTLSGDSNTVMFTVSGPTNSGRNFMLPVEWKVSNPSLGWIGEAAGDRAYYHRTSAGGDNVITVTDEYDRRGFAVVHQD